MIVVFCVRDDWKKALLLTLRFETEFERLQHVKDTDLCVEKVLQSREHVGKQLLQLLVFLLSRTSVIAKEDRIKK